MVVDKTCLSMLVWVMKIDNKGKKLVYLLECGEKYYKIGVAQRMKNRLSSIRTGNPFPVHVVTKCLVVEAHRLEKEFHHRLKKRKVSGEWFNLSPEEVIEICTVINSPLKQKLFYRRPTMLEFGRTRVMDSSRKLWTIRRQELYEEPIEPMTLVGEKKTEQKILNNKHKQSNDAELITNAKFEIINAGIASASFLQRRLSIGYARAARILDILEGQGIVGPLNGKNQRQVLATQTEQAK